MGSLAGRRLRNKRSPGRGAVELARDGGSGGLSRILYLSHSGPAAAGNPLSATGRSLSCQERALYERRSWAQGDRIGKSACAERRNLSRRSQTTVALARLAAKLCAARSGSSAQGGYARPFGIRSAPPYGVAGADCRVFLCARGQGLPVRRL